jgi:hypothetical protein
MKTHKLFTIQILIMLVVFTSCERKQEATYRTYSIFTKIDSLRSNYLNIHDSLVLYWNRTVIENQKHIALLQKLEEKIDELDSVNDEKLNIISKKLNNLKQVEFNIETISNSKLYTEYSELSAELKNELFLLANELQEDEKLEKLIGMLREAELKAKQSKEKYNKTAAEFNQFINKYRGLIKDITYQDSIAERPLLNAQN